MIEPVKQDGVSRAFTILNVLAGSATGLGLGQIQKRCPGIPRATLIRLLTRLVRDDLVIKSGPRGVYGLGETSLRFARAAMGVASRAEIVKPVVDWLAHTTKRSAVYAELEGEQCFFPYKCEPAQAFHYRDVNVRSPELIQNTIGRMLLAYQDKPFIDHVLANKAIYPRETPVRELRKRLTAIVRDGVAAEADIHPNAHVRIVAPVITDPAHKPCGAVAISMFAPPPPPETIDLLTDQVREAARRIRRRIRKIEIQSTPEKTE